MGGTSEVPAAGSLCGAHAPSPSPQGKFKMRVKALEYVGGQHVCSLPEKDRQGVIHVKPTSLSDSLEVRASVVCDVCPCEQVRVVFADVPPSWECVRQHVRVLLSSCSSVPAAPAFQSWRF